MTISEKLLAFLADVKGDHDRERSWELCYGYFHHHCHEAIRADRDQAALQLGFYLASWGMYRGSGFLLQYAYTVHRAVVDCLLQPKFSQLWNQEFGAGQSDATLIPPIVKLAESIRTVYNPFAKAKDKLITDTLVTKVILGTMGCLPAMDYYFAKGYRYSGFRVSDPVNAKFIQSLLTFCQNKLSDLKSQQARIEQSNGVHYPLMKLVDMYFHQIGIEVDLPKSKKKSQSA